MQGQLLPKRYPPTGFEASKRRPLPIEMSPHQRKLAWACKQHLQQLTRMFHYYPALLSYLFQKVAVANACRNKMALKIVSFLAGAERLSLHRFLMASISLLGLWYLSQKTENFSNHSYIPLDLQQNLL
ncbi:unnamed protein product [Ceratitis capitata]|uniref:(Mediterranean fruit fly) hypothetical protein n=1 Tax=Ceratitis capitata TaxID=7213 RepID=A0A811VG72_CERCA|nr:unnamed protein product [Ceratitis capitata]